MGEGGGTGKLPLVLKPGISLDGKVSEGDLVRVEEGSIPETVTSIDETRLKTLFRFDKKSIVRRRIFLECGLRVPIGYSDYNNRIENYDKYSPDELERQFYEAADKHLRRLRR